MIWWRPTYPCRVYRSWVESQAVKFKGRLGHSLVDRHFMVERLPEPQNDRDHLRW